MNKFALLLLKALQVSILALVTWGLLPVVWLGSQLYGRPPNVLHIRTQASRYLHYTWTADLENDPPYPTGARIWLTLCIVEKCFMSRLVGLAWLLDQVLYGKQLQQMDVHNPFFVISGGRSGSTQLTRYLEQDADSFVAPSILMCMFPYLWLWRLVPKTIGRFVTPDQVREFLCQMVPKESLERHEMDPFQADTFDGAFLSHHLNAMSLNLGTTVGTMEFNLAEFAPHNRSLVEQDYVAFIDGIARKTLLHHGQKPQPKTARFYLKGHFLLAAPALARKYPDCSMLTVVRDPLKRLQSGINFLYVNPPDPFLGRVSWGWLSQILCETEARYCDIEKEWFEDNDDKSSVLKCVIHFDDFVEDLPGTMTQVYQECFADQKAPPPHIATLQHAPRDRTNYSINRSLDELGIDQEMLRRRVTDYIDWLNSIQKNKE